MIGTKLDIKHNKLEVIGIFYIHDETVLYQTEQQHNEKKGMQTAKIHYEQNIPYFVAEGYNIFLDMRYLFND
jgi:hypothetical protein